MLELCKQLVSSIKSLHLRLKPKISPSDSPLRTETFLFQLEAENKIKKKSPSQKKRDYQRSKTFLETKSNNSKDSQEQVFVVDKPALENSALEDACSNKHNLNFKCDLCDYTSSYKHGVNVHIGGSHKGSKPQENLRGNSFKHSCNISDVDEIRREH